MSFIQHYIEKKAAKFCIWTIQQHNYIINRIRLYVWSASATVLFLSLINKIHLQMALHIILFGTISIVVMIWVLLSIRKALLLRINDPELKKIVYEAMLVFISSREKYPAKQ